MRKITAVSSKNNAQTFIHSISLFTIPQFSVTHEFVVNQLLIPFTCTLGWAEKQI